MKLFQILAFCVFAIVHTTSAQLTLTTEGRVGIGTDAPMAVLQVNSHASTFLPSIAIYDSTGFSQGGGILQFRNVYEQLHHLNIRGSVGMNQYGVDSAMDFLFGNTRMMSLEGGIAYDQYLYYSVYKGAFRSGKYNYSETGDFSANMGFNNTASGQHSLAFGSGTVATHNGSVAIGNAAVSQEFNTVAIGTEPLASFPYAMAFGYQAVASDSFAIGIGHNVHASGKRSLSTGYQTNASALNSTAMGYGTTASGSNSFASGYFTQATAYASTALGQQTYATAPGATSFGTFTLASGGSSVAMNGLTHAAGVSSLSSGVYTKASGYASSSFGIFTHARSYTSAAFGVYNDTIAASSTDEWVETDPLFVIGNGTDDEDLHNALTVYKNGIVLAKNPTAVSDAPTIPVPVSGSGTRMMWLPQKGAFFVGTVLGSDWNAENIGTNARSLGYNCKSSGYSSTTIGSYGKATGNFSTSIGFQALAFGESSVSIGFNSQSDGELSMSFGNFAHALTDLSFAFGDRAYADVYQSMALGMNNEGIGGSATEWVDTDPLLYIGNGEDDDHRSNAVVVYKNGDTDISGYTKLGATSPAIKMKQLPVTNLSPTSFGHVNVPHGLNPDKILSVNIMVEYFTDMFAPPAYTPGLSLFYHYLIHDNNIRIQNDTPPDNCGICDKPAKILITYME